MKSAKVLGLFAVALAALLAMGGTASATTLTSPAGTTYTGTIKAESSNLTMTSAFGGFGSIGCNRSSIEGVVKSHGSASTVNVSITKWTLTECTGGEFTDPTATPGTWEVHKIASENAGTVTSLGANFIMHNTSLGTCTFSTSASGTSIGTLTGSTSATTKAVLDMKGTIPATAGFCGQATWEGSYTVTSPVPLIVD